jgi:CheY-like chemotaxis protein
MSHEVRTPMNAIIGFIDVLCKSETSNDRLEKLNIIKESGASLMNVIDDILDFSKIESGKFNIDNHLFKTEEPFELTTKLFTEKAKQKGISINLNIDEDVPKDAFGDITRVKQIYSNLLSNAIKFSHQNSKIEVHLSYIQPSYSLLCSVQDSGIGIAKDNIDRIFQVFEQEDTSTTRNFGGSGLGLSISKSLAKMMNGDLYLESELNKGSTFFFRVELFKDVDRELVLSQGVELESASSNSPLHAKVLLVEDNKSNQLLMNILLDELGLESDIANDGLEAVEAYNSRKYDLILMDENMPNLNGIQATAVIRKHEHEKGDTQTPIIAVTANALKGDRERFLDAGMNDYIAKPIDQVELEKVIRKHLS